MKRDEANFKKWFLSHYDWSMTVEPALGTGDGMPDVLFLPSPGAGLLLAELKVGTIRDEVLYPEKVRPSQIYFMRDLQKSGGASMIITGVWFEEEGEWRAWILGSSQWRLASRWKGGWELDQLVEYCPLT